MPQGRSFTAFLRPRRVPASTTRYRLSLASSSVAPTVLIVHLSLPTSPPQESTTAHGDLWKALWDRGHKTEVVAVVRRWEEDRRVGRVHANWARYPRPSEIDEETRRELARIKQAIIGGDVRVLDEYGGLQAAMKRAVALEKRARRRAGSGADGASRHMADGSARWGSIPLGDLAPMPYRRYA